MRGRIVILIASIVSLAAAAPAFAAAPATPAAAPAGAAAVKSPAEYLGFEIGADRKLADYEQARRLLRDARRGLAVGHGQEESARRRSESR